MKKLVVLMSLVLSACSSPKEPVSGDLEVHRIEDLSQLVKQSGEGTFGLVSASKMVSFQITNQGNENSEVPVLSLTGAQASDFAIVYSSGCSASIKPKALCIVKVNFNPQGKAAGVFNATLNVSSLAIPLSATVGASAGAPLNLKVTENEVSVSNLNFGSLSGQQSLIKTLKVTNQGSLPSGVLTTSLNNNSFSLLTNSCNKSLAVKESCYIKIGTSASGKVNGALSSVLSFGRSGGSAPVDAQTSLLLHFDNNLTDSSLNGLIASTAGGSVSASGGKFDGGANVDAGQIIKVNSTPAGGALDLEDKDFTVEVWAKSTSFGSYGQLLNHYGWGYTGGWQFYLIGGASVGAYIVLPGNGVVQFQGNVNITPNVFHHYALVRKNNIVKIYFDGQQIAESPIVGAIKHNPNLALGIGGWGDFPNAENIRGVIDEVRISKNSARYESDFTPATAAFGSGGNNLDIPLSANIQSTLATGAAQGVILTAALNNQAMGAELDLGDLPSSSGVNRILTFKNEGSVTSSPLSLVLSGADASAFTIYNGCLNKVLAPGASCTVRLIFSADNKNAGDYAATLNIGDKSYAIKSTVLNSETCPVFMNLVDGVCVSPSSSASRYRIKFLENLPQAGVLVLSELQVIQGGVAKRFSEFAGLSVSLPNFNLFGSISDGSFLQDSGNYVYAFANPKPSAVLTFSSPVVIDGFAIGVTGFPGPIESLPSLIEVEKSNDGLVWELVYTKRFTNGDIIGNVRKDLLFANSNPTSCAVDETMYLGACMPTAISCSMPNGVGSRTLNTSTGIYGVCEVVSCNSGYVSNGTGCVPPVVYSPQTSSKFRLTINGRDGVGGSLVISEIQLIENGTARTLNTFSGLSFTTSNLNIFGNLSNGYFTQDDGNYSYSTVFPASLTFSFASEHSIDGFAVGFSGFPGPLESTPTSVTLETSVDGVMWSPIKTYTYVRADFVGNTRFDFLY